MTEKWKIEGNIATKALMYSAIPRERVPACPAKIVIDLEKLYLVEYRFEMCAARGGGHWYKLASRPVQWDELAEALGINGAMLDMARWATAMAEAAVSWRRTSHYDTMYVEEVEKNARECAQAARQVRDELQKQLAKYR